MSRVDEPFLGRGWNGCDCNETANDRALALRITDHAAIINSLTALITATCRFVSRVA
jgi:hypothetical protein